MPAEILTRSLGFTTTSLATRNRMKPAIVANLMLAFLILCSPRGFVADLTAQDAAPQSAEAEIRRLNAEEVDAFLGNDPKAMARLWSDDFVVTNPLNRFATKQQVLGMVNSGFLVITSYDRRVEYLRQYADVVVVAGAETVVWGGKMPNAGKTEQLRFTGIWMKQQGRWQQVARHANVVP
jgi:ketosteroid isomerase-like protein